MDKQGHNVSGDNVVGKALNDPARYTMGAGVVRFNENGTIEVHDTGDYDFNYQNGGGEGAYSAMRQLGYTLGVRESAPSGAKTHYSGKANILDYE